MYCLFHKLISMQDVGHMLHLNVAWLLPPSLYVSLSYLPYQWQRYWVVEQAISICFAFGIDLNKILLPVVVVRTKAEKPDIYFYIRYTSKLSKDMQSGSKLCSWLMFSKKVNESEKYQYLILVLMSAFSHTSI